MKKPFDGFAIKRQQGKLFAIDFGGYETRNPSTLSLIQQAVDRHAVKDFGWIMINTTDREAQLVHEGLKVFAYSTATDNFAHVCPDFVYDHWRQTGLADYEETRLQLAAMADPPATDMLGWRGAPTHPARGTLVQFDDKKDFDCELIHWDRSDPNNLQSQELRLVPRPDRALALSDRHRGHRLFGPLQVVVERAAPGFPAGAAAQGGLFPIPRAVDALRAGQARPVGPAREFGRRQSRSRTWKNRLSPMRANLPANT